MSFFCTCFAFQKQLSFKSFGMLGDLNIVEETADIAVPLVKEVEVLCSFKTIAVAVKNANQEAYNL